MSSWNIFKHALGMIFNDIGTALRVSGPIIAVALLGVALFILMGPAFVLGGPGGLGGVFVLGVLNYIAALWVAVPWHRYCLLEEYPDGVLPAFNGSRILAYFGWALGLGLIVVGMIAVLVGIVYAIGGASRGAFSTLGWAILVVGMIFAIWVSQRLSLVLPASAIGKSISLSDSWNATRPIATVILVVFLLMALLALGLGFVVGFLGAFSALIGFVLQAVLNWILAMVGLSVLTTYYGVCIEDRALS